MLLGNSGDQRRPIVSLSLVDVGREEAKQTYSPHLLGLVVGTYHLHNGFPPFLIF